MLWLGELEYNAHSVHNEDPVTFLKVLAKHSEHVPPSCPVNPKLHVQDDAKTAAVGELENGEQSVHAKEPFDTLYLPVAHAMHEVPFAPVYPALQMQSISRLLPGSECDCGRGHSAQVDD